MDSNKQAYENVALHDDSDDALSGTEVDESLMEDEKSWHPTRRSRRRTCLQLFKSYRWMIDTFLLLVIIGLLLLLRQEWASHDRSDYPRSSYQLGGDFTGAGPHCEFSSFLLRHKRVPAGAESHLMLMRLHLVDTKIVKFESDKSFVPMEPADFFSNETLATWNSMMPGMNPYGPEGLESKTPIGMSSADLFILKLVRDGAKREQRSLPPP